MGLKSEYFRTFVSGSGGKVLKATLEWSFRGTSTVTSNQKPVGSSGVKFFQTLGFIK